MLIDPETSVQTEMRHRLERLPDPDSVGFERRKTHLRRPLVRRLGRI